MSDITKCLSTDCSLKEKCLRWTAPADEQWQSYVDFRYIDGKCDYYIPEVKNGL